MKFQALIVALLISLCAAQLAPADLCMHHLQESASIIARLKSPDTKSLMYLAKATFEMKGLYDNMTGSIEVCKGVMTSQIVGKLASFPIPSAKCFLAVFSLFSDLSKFAKDYNEAHYRIAAFDAVAAARQLTVAIGDCKQA